MAKSKIEWTDMSLNPVVGCSKVADGCKNCYAETMAKRLKAMGQEVYQDVIGVDGLWTGTVHLIPERLEEPKKWTKPQKVFICSMSDLFHKDVPDEYINQVMDMCSKYNSHTYIILTKRVKRMAEYFSNKPALHNVWPGCSISTQRDANQNVPELIRIKSQVKLVSCEPLLGRIDLTKIEGDEKIDAIGLKSFDTVNAFSSGLNWVICGGETGGGARPVREEWVTFLRDQCIENNVPFFFKQWGKGKKGNLLEKRVWEQFPKGT